MPEAPTKPIVPKGKRLPLSEGILLALCSGSVQTNYGWCIAYLILLVCYFIKSIFLLSKDKMNLRDNFPDGTILLQRVFHSLYFTMYFLAGNKYLISI